MSSSELKQRYTGDFPNSSVPPPADHQAEPQATTAGG